MKQISNKALEKLSHHKQVYFAIFCAEQVLYLVPQEHQEVALKAIEVAKAFLDGKASKEECYAAASAAHAASYAASYAAHAAAHAAASASATSSREKVIKEQWDFFDQLLNGDKYFEDIVLKGVI